MILNVFLDFLLNAIYKGARISKTLMKEGFELVPDVWHDGFAFELTFMWLLAKKSAILEK